MTVLVDGCVVSWIFCHKRFLLYHGLSFGSMCAGTLSRTKNLPQTMDWPSVSKEMEKILSPGNAP